MRFSIPRLRAVLIAGAALLVLVLVAYIGVGRYQSLMVYRRLLKKSGVSFTHDTNGFTYSQSVLDRKIFTLHAAKATQLGSGRWALHDADLTLFDHAGRPSDHITGSEIDYDEAEGVARAQGVVDMELQPPQGLSNSGRSAPSTPARAEQATATAASPKTPQAVHVRTSGLVYRRKLGIATTDQRVEFQYGGMNCAALGAEFDSQDSTLRLLAQVSMEGIAHGKPMHVTAASAEMNRDSNMAMLLRPVVSSNGQSASADKGLLDLRKDGSIERLQGIDHVVLRSETELVTAARLDATLNQQTLPEKARLSGGVSMTGRDTARPMQGSAATVDADFDAHGAPTTVTATGGAKFSVVDRKADARGLNRSLEAATIVGLFVPGRGRSSARLREVHAAGGGHATGDSIVSVKGAGVAAGRKTIQVWGDDLRLGFIADTDGKPQAQTLNVTGHTILQQDAALGEQEISRGDTLTVAFAPEAKSGSKPVGKSGLAVASAVQSGHVMIKNRGAGKVGSTEPGVRTEGTAERAAFEGATQRLTLSGNAHLESDDASLVAPVVVIDQATEDAEAHGGVQATMQNAAPDGSAGKPAPVTHVLAASARFGHAAKTAEFRGTDEQPAKMWQDASQVQAATLLFDGVRKTFSARPEDAGAMIHAVFAGTPSAPKPGGVPRPASIMRVISPKMDYNDLLREATFSGGVTVDGGMGEVRGERAVVFLTPAAKKEAQLAPAARPNPFGGSAGSGGSIDRVVVSGEVQMVQPGRRGTGDQLVYIAATGGYVLTGTPVTPPKIVDARQGSVTGATLIFSDAGSTIVVAGDAGAARAQGGRVRSEMSVRPKSEDR